MPSMPDLDSANRVKRHLAKLGRDEILKISHRLVATALRKTRKDRACDLAQQAFEYALSGRRVWNQDTQPDFVHFMVNVVLSLASNDYTGAENRRTNRQLVVVADAFDSIESGEVGSCISAVAPANNPARIVEAERQIEYIGARLEELEKDGPLLAHLFRLTKVAGHSPEEVAGELKLSVPDVYNLNRRLERALKRLYDPDTFVPPNDLTRPH